jgi:hypothetical protein
MTPPCSADRSGVVHRPEERRPVEADLVQRRDDAEHLDGEHGVTPAFPQDVADEIRREEHQPGADRYSP